MVDMTTYKKLHPQDHHKGAPYRNDLGPDKMSQDNPQLKDVFYMNLPLEIVGFNMQTKEWSESVQVIGINQQPADEIMQ